MSSEILKYNFLTDFAKKLTHLDAYNLASLYIEKHALGELYHLQEQMVSQKNVINHSQWDSFCKSSDYDKSYNLLKAVLKNC